MRKLNILNVMLLWIKDAWMTSHNFADSSRGGWKRMGTLLVLAGQIPKSC